MSCSLIIATYNWPQALALCLASVSRQVMLPAEVIIADDGSGDATANLIRELQQNFPVPLRHIWHEDQGFRLAAIRNKAVAAAASDYIIQIDGDLILHSHFVADHMEMKKPGFFTAGSRVMLNEKISKRIIESGTPDRPVTGRQTLLFNNFRSRLLRSILAKRYKIKGRHRFYVKGCNMAFHRADLLRVNGYNEAFEGWGSEDRELAIRLINAGVQKQSLKMGGVCYHLYHKLTSKHNEIQNQKLMREAIGTHSTRSKLGLDQYLTSFQPETNKPSVPE